MLFPSNKDKILVHQDFHKFIFNLAINHFYANFGAFSLFSIMDHLKFFPTFFPNLNLQNTGDFLSP